MTYNKKCIYFTPYYSQQDKQGKPKVGKYWCVARQGFIKKCPKICKSSDMKGGKEEKENLNG